MPETRKCGGWIFQISLDSMPEKVATAFGELNKLKGVRYKPVAYLGSQVVNGTNYAVLAEQVIFDAENTKNLVLIVFNVAPNAPEATVVYIKPVLDGFSESSSLTISRLPKTLRRISILSKKNLSDRMLNRSHSLQNKLQRASITTSWPLSPRFILVQNQVLT